MTNTEELNIAILRSGLTKREIAKRLGISEQSLLLKITNKNEFKASEIGKMCEILKLNDNSIFFAKESESDSLIAPLV